MRLHPLDLASASALAAAYTVECEATSATRPGWVPLGRAARVAAWGADEAWRHEMLGAFEGDDLIGFGVLSTAHDTPDTSWVDVAVRPTHQRLGVGSHLVRALEARSPEAVTRFVASAYRPTRADLDGLERGFARPLGYTRASAETVVELDLAGAELSPRPLADGLRVETHLGGVPAHWRPQVGVLKGLVDAEAPHGELGWQPTPVTVEAYDAELALWAEQGRTVVEAIALAGDRVVAWTCVVVAADPGRPAQVEGTLVLAEHRGQGLGRAVKVASLGAVRHLGRSTRVRTSSDDRNTWMRAINDELGFVPVESEILVQKRRASGGT